MGCSLAPAAVPEDAYIKTQLLSVYELAANRGDDTFSHRNKYHLRRTWKHLSTDRQEKGIAIFLQIFKACPKAKELFPFRKLDNDALRRDPLFRVHALRFMHAVDTTIQSLDALDLAVIPVLHQLGGKHVWIAGFNLNLLPVFMNSLLYVFEIELGRDFTQDVKEAWLQLARFITAHLTIGYKQALGTSSAPYTGPHPGGAQIAVHQKSTDNSTGSAINTADQAGEHNDTSNDCHHKAPGDDGLPGEKNVNCEAVKENDVDVPNAEEAILSCEDNGVCSHNGGEISGEGVPLSDEDLNHSLEGVPLNGKVNGLNGSCGAVPMKEFPNMNGGLKSAVMCPYSMHKDLEGLTQLDEEVESIECQTLAQKQLIRETLSGFYVSVDEGDETIVKSDGNIKLSNGDHGVHHETKESGTGGMNGTEAGSKKRSDVAIECLKMSDITVNMANVMVTSMPD